MIALFTRAYLAVAGLTAAAIGGLILLAPVAFYAGYGLDVGGQVSLLSELRAHALLLFGIGVFIGSGAFLDRWTYPALVAGAVGYLSYGLSRLIGVGFDGLPSSSLQFAGATELLLGSLALLLLWLRHRQPALAR